MSILNLTLYPDDPLTKIAAPIESVTQEHMTIARNMLETMYAHEGVGLAGPQVGLAQRIFVLRDPDGDEMCLINPELSEMEGREEGEEGCLSLPQIYASVPRAVRLRVRALDPTGAALDFEATDFVARIIQHENDHLDGVIFLDRLDILTRQAKLQEWEETRARRLIALNRS